MVTKLNRICTENNMVNKQTIIRYFKVHEKIKSGGGRTEFYLMEFKDDCLIIQPTNTNKSASLYYYEINAVFMHFDYLETLDRPITGGKNDIGKVNLALEMCELEMQTSTECYIYGFVKEFKYRSSIK